ncbi:MAG: CoA transferase [Pontixanthobacter sp.]
MYELLNDLSVVEVSSFVASPTAGLYCAQMGAEIIRVDQIGGGLDYDRYQLTEEGRSLSWENLNRAKKSVAVDMRNEEGRELVRELARATGQLITNVPEKSFLSHAAVAEGRPDMITVRIMGWGDGRQAMDFTVNAASGYPLMTGPAEWDQDEAPPVNQLLPAWDFITGAYTAFSLLAALRHRDRTGEGSELRIPLGDVAIGTVANSGSMAEMLFRGGDRPRLGNAIWGAFGRDFRSKDGLRFMVAALTSKQWAGLIEAFGVAEQVAAIETEHGVSFAHSDHNRFTHRDALFALFQSVADTLDYDTLAKRLAAAGTTFERYRTMHEASTDPELVTNNPFFGPSTDNPSGFEYPAPGPFANMPERPRGAPKPAPYLGADSEEVLAERLGLGSGTIAALIDKGLVARSDEGNLATRT